MPILHVRALPQNDNSSTQEALKKTCLAIAEVYGCEPSQVWATWTPIDPGFYFEGEKGPMAQPRLSHPPICELICFEGKSPDEVSELLLVASKTLSRGLGMEDNIFMTYREARSGEVVAGNGVVRK